MYINNFCISKYNCFILYLEQKQLQQIKPKRNFLVGKASGSRTCLLNCKEIIIIYIATADTIIKCVNKIMIINY